MIVIALKGIQNSGKTSSLKIVYDYLVKNEWKSEPDAKRILEEEDIYDILTKGVFRIGFVTQGDYGGDKKNSVKQYLRAFDNKSCGVTICACSLTLKGRDRQGIQTSINHYEFVSYVEKTIVDATNGNDKMGQDEANKKDALEVLRRFNKVIACIKSRKIDHLCEE